MTDHEELLARADAWLASPLTLGVIRLVRDLRAALATRAEPDIEVAAAAVHQAYLDTCERLGWPVKPANQIPYDELPEDSKELDRASVRAVWAVASAAPEEDT